MAIIRRTELNTGEALRGEVAIAEDTDIGVTRVQTSVRLGELRELLAETKQYASDSLVSIRLEFSPKGHPEGVYGAILVTDVAAQADFS